MTAHYDWTCGANQPADQHVRDFLNRDHAAHVWARSDMMEREFEAHMAAGGDICGVRA